MPQIQPIDIVAPGSFGLNTEKASTLLRPQWATTALNAAINRSGRIGARKGWASQTATAIAGTPTIDVIHEQIIKNGNKTIISCAGNKIYKNVADFTDAANDITSPTVPTNDNWKFVNLGNNCFGFQRGHIPIIRGTGDFADLTGSGVLPDGNDAVAAFGRLWALDKDKQTIRYSALLDGQDFTAASGGGTIDMTSVWTMGADECVAIAALGANLIVFGKNHIVIWADGSGSEIGLDPTRLEIVDTIEGTGCIARDSIAATGEGDLIYLSRHGLQSLGRVIQSKSNPVVTLTKNVRSRFLEAVAKQIAVDQELDQVRAIHDPTEGLYIINFPVYGSMFALDTQHPFQDDDGEQAVPVLQWQVGGSIIGMKSTATAGIYFGSAGVVGKYSLNQDNAATYSFEYLSGWLDFDQLNHRLKILKEFVSVLSVGVGDVNHVWEFDFTGTTNTRTHTYTGVASAEFNDLASGAEFNLGEFSGGVRIQRKTLPAFGEGQFIRLGVTATINSFDLVVQQASIAPKIGRMVT
jgi:hypothetical protein